MRLIVKTRVFINVFDEQIGGSFAPSLEGLDGRLMVQSALREAVVVGGKVLGEHAFEDGDASHQWMRALVQKLFQRTVQSA